MLTVAIVEDDDAAAHRLTASLRAFGSQHGTSFDVVRFREATGFLGTYKPVYDLVFMDIEMPGMNGMEAARRLRERDAQVLLIFVTNLAQYAAEGYEVEAMDYVMKPVSYADLEVKLQRAVRVASTSSASVVVTQQGATHRILLRDIAYIEVRGHSLLFHTTHGVVRGGGTLQDTEDKLGDKGFLRCSKAFVVNHKHVRLVKGSVLALTSGEELTIGRAFRKRFMSELARSIGEANVF